jgi:hypothetical protein
MTGRRSSAESPPTLTDLGDVGVVWVVRGVCAVGRSPGVSRGAAGVGFALARCVRGAAGAGSYERLERGGPAPRVAGDDVVPDSSLVTNHAITIAAPPQEVWPWLTRMGWRRAGWYTPGGWTGSCPANWPSTDVLDPALVRDLGVGDTIPDGPPGYGVLRRRAGTGAARGSCCTGTTHLPRSWAQRRHAGTDWTWA